MGGLSVCVCVCVCVRGVCVWGCVCVCGYYTMPLGLRPSLEYRRQCTGIEGVGENGWYDEASGSRPRVPMF